LQVNVVDIGDEEVTVVAANARKNIEALKVGDEVNALVRGMMVDGTIVCDIGCDRTVFIKDKSLQGRKAKEHRAFNTHIKARVESIDLSTRTVLITHLEWAKGSYTERVPEGQRIRNTEQYRWVR